MACASTSFARRRNAISLDNPPSRPNKKTLIYDHVQSMNPCDNPHLFYHHGQFLAQGKGPWPQPEIIPQFSYSTTALHQDIRLPVPPEWEESYDDSEFDQKHDQRLLWRGENSGILSDKARLWKRSHRHYLVSYANDLEGTIEVLPSNRTTKETIGVLKVHKKAYLNPAMMDIAFLDPPISCSDDTCERLSGMYPWRKRQTKKEEGNYKYVLDVRPLLTVPESDI